MSALQRLARISHTPREKCARRAEVETRCASLRGRPEATFRLLRPAPIPSQGIGRPVPISQPDSGCEISRLGLVLIVVMMMTSAAVRASGAATGDVVIVTNEVANYRLPKEQPSVTFEMTNQFDEPYLWIMARGCKGEAFPDARLKIEINGVEIGSECSELQGKTFRMPLSYGRLYESKKYDPELKSWRFKWDVDFVLNNQCGTNLGLNFTTVGLNHWYAFNVKGVAVKGINRVTLTHPSRPNNFYDGFVIGALWFGTLEDMKRRVADYEKQQIAIDPEQLSYEKRAKELYNLEIPKGTVQKFAVNNGYIHRDGKPFFMAYANPFSAGRESVLKIYNYYGLINVRMSGVSFLPTLEIFSLPIWLKEGWDKYHLQPWEMGELLNETRLNYDEGILTLLYSAEAIILARGDYWLDNYPEVIAQTADGTRLRDEFGYMAANKISPVYQEYLRQCHTVLGRVFKDHPGVLGLSPWEEMGWRVGQGPGKLVPQSPADLKRYQGWLEKKYGSIGKLNEEWGVDYKTFEDVKFPGWKEQTANFAKFQAWRSEATVKCAEVIYKAFKEAAPDQLVMGQKTYGERGISSGYWKQAIDNWALTEWTDISREFSWEASLGLASCRAYGDKVMESAIWSVSCDYIQQDKWSGLDPKKNKAPYSYIMRLAFRGNKAMHWETYDLHYNSWFHLIHYNKRWAKENKTFDNMRYASSGTADVVIEERTLKAARIQQWIMRNASLVLPASVPKPDVAVLMTTASPMIGYDPNNKLALTKRIIPSTDLDNAGQDFYFLGALFDNMHLRFDCVEERIIDEIFKYKVLIVGYQANVMSRNTAEKIIYFVKKGGTVLFYPEGGTWDSINFQKDKAVNEISPGFGLSELLAAKIDNDKIIEQKGIVVKKEISGYKAGETVMTNRYFGVKLESIGGEVMAVTEDGQPVLVKGGNGRTYYFGGYLGCMYYQGAHERIARLVEGILKTAGVEKRVEIEGMADRKNVLPDLLEGEGYWLVSVNNFGDEEKNLKIKVNGLPGNEYEVVDISGEGLTFEKDAGGSFHLKPDPEGAKAKYVTEKISGKELAKAGFEGNVEKCMSRVWLIRPAGVEVWVNATKEALRSYVELRKPLKIVVGHGCNGEEEKLAEELSQVLAKKGLSVAVVKDSEIKARVMEGKLEEDGCELEKYSHKVIDEDANLILIGNASENSVVKHLETAGNYVFSKVPEIVDEKYPGKGRGIIQLVESVNHYSYDATDKGRDAILAGGSDGEGTIKAIKELTRIMK